MEAVPEIIKPFATLALPDETALESFAASLAPILKSGDVVLLKGDLGTGKTSLARALIRALCGSQIEVPSPTYTIMQSYETNSVSIIHFDLYRLSTEDDILELGWYSALQDLVLVEWPERLGSLTPSGALTIGITFEGFGRRLDFWGSETWCTNLMTVL